MSTASGIYGLTFDFADPGNLLIEAAATWRPLSVEVDGAPPNTTMSGFIDENSARLPLGDGCGVVMQAHPLHARFLGRRYPTDELIHPILAPVAAIAAHWRAEEPVHAGAVVGSSGAWLIMGAKEAGKSTMMAALSRAGFPVLSDDLAIFDGVSVLAGPRCIDLRPDAAMRFGASQTMMRGHEPRSRILLPPVEPEVRLAGWVTLGWSSEVTRTPVSAANRLAAVAPHRSLLLEPRDPRVLLDLSAHPGYHLDRPRSWAALDEVTDNLAALIS